MDYNQSSGPRTTADSKAEGRLKDGVGGRSSKRKKKKSILQKVVRKYSY